MKLLKKAADLDPLDLGIRLKIALLLSMTGDDDKALAEINRVLEMDPELEKAHFSKATILLSKNDVDAAMKEAEKEVALLNSASTQASFLLGRIYMDRKDYEKAKEKLQWAIKWSPHAPFVAEARRMLEIIKRIENNERDEPKE
jgi:tetratricopeptide (TPR) repeat protein